MIIRLIPIVFTLMFSASALGNECVILLHGLARVSNGMSELATKLQRSGYEVANIGYPSRKFSVPELAESAIGEGLQSCSEKTDGKVNFVVHSMGGILLRYYLSVNDLPNLGRSVMLGTPNQGAQLVDRLRGWPGFSLLGPGAYSLGTAEDGIVHEIGAVEFELGVIAGNVNINPLAGLLLNSESDSVVRVESTKVEGMKEHLVLPVIHTTMMRNNRVIDHAIHFLKTGNFIPQ